MKGSESCVWQNLLAKPTKKGTLEIEIIEGMIGLASLFSEERRSYPGIFVLKPKFEMNVNRFTDVEHAMVNEVMKSLSAHNRWQDEAYKYTDQLYFDNLAKYGIISNSRPFHHFHGPCDPPRPEGMHRMCLPIYLDLDLKWIARFDMFDVL